MRLKTRIAMESNPGFHVDASLDPLDFRASLRGSCKATVDSVSLRIDEIPVRVAIPFLKPRRRQPLLGSIGGFNITLSPLHIRADGMNVKLDGVLGTKGLGAKLDGKVDCTTEMMVDGKIAGKVGTFSVELNDEDPDPLQAE